MQLSRLAALASSPACWVGLLICGWLAYSFGILAWYLLNDPAFMASICKETSP